MKKADLSANKSNLNLEWFMGIMSGTSLDGVDLAAVCFHGDQIHDIVTHYVEYPEALRTELAHTALSPTFNCIQFGELQVKLGKFYADCALQFTQQPKYQAKIGQQELKAIGNHGQTIRHHPKGAHAFTMQIGDPHYLCMALKTPICYDFRSMDMAAQGQGAPLAPLFHEAFFPSAPDLKQSVYTVVLNLGGIANITVLEHKITGEIKTHACDTGPANTLLNQWVYRHLKQSFDKNGAWGASGECNITLLQRLLQHPYFEAPTPKSTGPEIFNIDWLDSQLKSLNLSNEDVQATLYHFTVESVAMHIEKLLSQTHSSSGQNKIIIAGGGTRNPLLMELLQTRLATLAVVMSSEDFNLDPEFLEAAAFAWLAKQRFYHKPVNTFHFTGATQPIVLGSMIVPALID